MHQIHQNYSRIGVMTWRKCRGAIPWNLGVVRHRYQPGFSTPVDKAAPWLATWISSSFGLQSATALTILAVLSLFLILIHLGVRQCDRPRCGDDSYRHFGAAKRADAGNQRRRHDHDPAVRGQFRHDLAGQTAPQNMVVYGTDTFSVRDFVRTGIPLTVIAYLLVLLMGATYWRWLGLLGS